MEVYIDKENLVSFIEARNNPNYKDCYEDCCRLLKRQLHINYNFEKSRDLLENELLRTYFVSSGQGVGNSDADSYISDKFPLRPIKSNVANSFSKKQRSAVFLIDDEKTNLLEDKGSLILGSFGKEVDALKTLFCGNDYDFHKIYDIQSKTSFSGWEQISKDKLNLPLSDIIVMDRYLGGQIPELIDYNLNKLLDVLVERVKAEVNIVFFCNKKFYSKDLKSDIIPNWEQFKKDIKGKVKNTTGCNCNVTLVFYSQSNVPHDRVIFTNYMMYRSGDSFCYYNSTGKMISNGTSLDVNSLAKKDNFDFAMSFIQQVQALYDDIKGLNNPNLILGDLKSNYLRL